MGTTNPSNEAKTVFGLHQGQDAYSNAFFTPVTSPYGNLYGVTAYVDS
jgi:hypothetical protein